MTLRHQAAGLHKQASRLRQKAKNVAKRKAAKAPPQPARKKQK